MKWLILLAGIAANASASVLIKMAMIPPRRFPSIKDPIATLSNWPLWLGIFLYGLAFLTYAAALTRLPLNVAHPILTTGSVAVVSILSVLVFRESLTWSTAAGVVLVVLGVILITGNFPQLPRIK